MVICKSVLQICTSNLKNQFFVPTFSKSKHKSSTSTREAPQKTNVNFVRSFLKQAGLKFVFFLACHKREFNKMVIQIQVELGIFLSAVHPRLEKLPRWPLKPLSEERFSNRIFF